MTATPPIQQYLRLRSEFLGYLYAMTRDVELSEEVYQNAAVIVLEKAEKEPLLNFRAWAKEVIRRQALHAIRSRATTNKLGKPVEPELLEAISTAFLSDEKQIANVEDEAKALNRCLDELTAKKRELIALRYESDASFEQIAERVGSTPSAVQRALSRIRRALHTCVLRRIQLAEST